MIDKDQTIPSLIQRCKRLEIGNYIEVTSYKRDRGLLIIRLDSQTLRIVEQGFAAQTLEIDERNLKRTLRPLIKHEFPRSHKLRLYEMGAYDEYLAARVKRKTL